MKTKSTICSLIVLALVNLSTPASAAINVSISSRLIEVTDTLFDRIGVDFNLPDIEVHLPERAANAVDNAFDRAEVAIDDVFGEGGVLDQVEVETPDVDQIVNDAIDQASEVLDGLEIPSVEVPDVDAIVEDALNDAQRAVDAARGEAQDAVDNAIEKARSLLNELEVDLPEVEAIFDDLLGETGVVDETIQVLELEPIDWSSLQLPDPILIDPLPGVVYLPTVPYTPPTLGGTVTVHYAPTLAMTSGTLVTMPAAAVPEPASGLLLGLGIGLATRRSR